MKKAIYLLPFLFINNIYATDIDCNGIFNENISPSEQKIKYKELVADMEIAAKQQTYSIGNNHEELTKAANLIDKQTTCLILYQLKSIVDIENPDRIGLIRQLLQKNNAITNKYQKILDSEIKKNTEHFSPYSQVSYTNEDACRYPLLLLLSTGKDPRGVIEYRLINNNEIYFKNEFVLKGTEPKCGKDYNDKTYQHIFGEEKTRSASEPKILNDNKYSDHKSTLKQLAENTPNNPTETVECVGDKFHYIKAKDYKLEKTLSSARETRSGKTGTLKKGTEVTYIKWRKSGPDGEISFLANGIEYGATICSWSKSVSGEY